MIALKNINPSLPMVAIGGITEDNIEPIAQNGADGVSVISRLHVVIILTRLLLK